MSLVQQISIMTFHIFNVSSDYMRNVRSEDIILILYIFQSEVCYMYDLCALIIWYLDMEHSSVGDTRFCQKKAEIWEYQMSWHITH